MDIEYIKAAIKKNLQQRLYGAEFSADIDFTPSSPEDLLKRNVFSPRKAIKLLLRISPLKKALSGPIRIYRSRKDKAVMKSFNRRNTGTVSLPKLGPVSEEVPEVAPKGFRDSLKRVPLLGGIMLWPWRLLKLPSRFHALSMEFMQVQQNINGYDTILSEARNESSRLASEIDDMKRRSEEGQFLINKFENRQIEEIKGRLIEFQSEIKDFQKRSESVQLLVNNFENSISRTESKIGAIEIKQNEFHNHMEGLNGRLLELQKENIDWTSFYMGDITEEMLEENIGHHRFFIDKAAEYAGSASRGGIPRIIEIGIGTATMSIHFSRGLYNVTGLDKNPDLVKKAEITNKRLGGHARYICMDAFDLKELFQPAFFDICFSQGTMEHFSNRDLEKILSAQLHAAKYVLFSVPSENWPRRDFRDERRMSRLDWETLLGNFGFKIDFIDYYHNGLHICCALKGAN